MPLSDAQKAAADDLEKSGYLPGLRNHAMARCVPFFWSSRGERQANYEHNGTVVYVNTGERHIGITADHVYAEYLKDLEALPDVVAQFNGNTFSPEKYLIDRSDNLDLATFDVPPIFVSSHSRACHFQNSVPWPPPTLKPGELVLYGGYPGELKQFGDMTLSFGFQTFTWLVTDVTPQNLVMHVDFPNLHWPGHEEEKINEKVGGISGGPVFRRREWLTDEPKRVKFDLVGIVYDYHQGMQVMRARPIHCVNADGTLNPL